MWLFEVFRSEGARIRFISGKMSTFDSKCVNIAADTAFGIYFDSQSTYARSTDATELCSLLSQKHKPYSPRSDEGERQANDFVQ